MQDQEETIRMSGPCDLEHLVTTGKIDGKKAEVSKELNSSMV